MMLNIAATKPATVPPSISKSLPKSSSMREFSYCASIVPVAILATKGYPRQQKSRSRQSELVCLVGLVCLVYLVGDSFNQMNEIDQMNQTNQFSYVGGLFGKAWSDGAAFVVTSDQTCDRC